VKYKLAIFDLDGTLVDSIHGIAYAMNSVLTKHCFPIHHIDLYKRFVGNGQNVLVQKSLPYGDYSNGMLDIFLSEYVLAYKQFWDYNMCVYDGINSLLKYLECKNVVINVNTNKNEKSTHQILQKYFPAVTFSDVIAGDTLTTRKPHPEGAIRIADNAGFTTGECVYIGDSDVDIETARNAGMDCISVAWGFRTKDELIAAGALCCVDHPDEIKKLI
jgi:phosphoglycolate phosphatase